MFIHGINVILISTLISQTILMLSSIANLYVLIVHILILYYTNTYTY